MLLLAAAASALSPPMPVTPLGSLITAADYPAGAMQHGIAGHVGFRLRVDATGKPDGCVVSHTSGSADLDNATCDLMLARARFKPALGPNGPPLRGDYAASLAWTLDNEPEPFASETISVRNALDSLGNVIACVATPVKAAAEFGGCKLFGDPRMLGRLVGRPLSGFSSIEVRMIKQVSTDAPIPDLVPAAAVKNVIARSTLVISPAGMISECTNDVTTRFDGRSLDLCAMVQADSDAKFTPSTAGLQRRIAIIMEIVSQAR
jgi:TonB family protein